MIVLNILLPIFPTTKAMTLELIKALTKAIEKPKNYKDLHTRMNRYKDILEDKIQNMPGENNIETDQETKEKETKKNNNGSNN